ncbi:BA75_02026T0 [Komagataella pastoris]|uniref:BA75_02026T0 n=1 Tax=Komagataella pastoris TaxID=4922 RepID=A0A1B2JBX9_PICPA|nr:BA75_02026T0 [Komagataella pastoris]
MNKSDLSPDYRATCCFRCFKPGTLPARNSNVNDIKTGQNCHLEGVMSKNLSTNGVDIKKLLRCSGCRVVNYCSLSCQLQDWNEFHSKECTYLKDYLKKYAMVPSTTEVLVNRILLKYKSNSLFKLQIDMLTSHLEVLEDEVYRGHVEHLEVLEQGQHILERFSNVSSEYAEDLMLLKRLVLTVFVNSTVMYNEFLEPNGLMFDSFFALINHSCEPNILAIFQDGKLTLKSVLDIKPGTELTTNYEFTNLPTAVRKLNLQSRFFFECQCPLCLNPIDRMLAVKCAGCGTIAGSFDLTEKIGSRNQLKMIGGFRKDGRTCFKCSREFPETFDNISTMFQNCLSTFIKDAQTYQVANRRRFVDDEEHLIKLLGCNFKVLDLATAIKYIKMIQLLQQCAMIPSNFYLKSHLLNLVIDYFSESADQITFTRLSLLESFNELQNEKENSVIRVFQKTHVLKSIALNLLNLTEWLSKSSNQPKYQESYDEWFHLESQAIVALSSFYFSLQGFAQVSSQQSEVFKQHFEDMALAGFTSSVLVLELLGSTSWFVESYSNLKFQLILQKLSLLLKLPQLSLKFSTQYYNDISNINIVGSNLSKRIIQFLRHKNISVTPQIVQTPTETSQFEIIESDHPGWLRQEVADRLSTPAGSSYALLPQYLRPS